MISEDIELFVAYWLNLSTDFLEAMGVDIGKRLTQEQLESLVNDQLGVDNKIRKSYFLTWLLDAAT